MITYKQYLLENLDFKNMKRYKEPGFVKYINSDISVLARKFADNGYSLYIVGGAVRDYLLGLEPKDLDLVTDALPEDVVRMGKELGFDSADIGNNMNFGITMLIGNIDRYEIATFREDEKGVSRMDVKFKKSDIHSDSKRRDLTINAMYYDMVNQEVIDLVGGYEDLKAKRIKTVGNPMERFEEDFIRVIRAIRFYLRYEESKIDSELKDVLSDDATIRNVIAKVSREKIMNEFKSILSKTKDNTKMITTFHKYGLWKVFFGDIAKFIDTEDIPKELVSIPHFIAYIFRNQLNPYENDDTVLKMLTKLKFSNIGDSILEKTVAISYLIHLDRKAFDRMKLRTIIRKVNDFGIHYDNQLKLLIKRFKLNESLIRNILDYRFDAEMTDNFMRDNPNLKQSDLGMALDAHEKQIFLKRIRGKF